MEAVLDRRQPDLTVLLENVHKAYNLSAVLRTCDAVGIQEMHAVSAGPRISVDHDTSAGTAKWLDVRAHATVLDAIAELRGRGFQVVAADPGEGAVDFRTLDYTRPTAFLMGAELFGISEEALAASDRRVRIPMAGMVHSLNVSVATALLLYEAFRQRDGAGFYRGPRMDPEARARRLFEWAHPAVAEECRRLGRPYPDLDGNGDIVVPGRPAPGGPPPKGRVAR